MTKNPTYDKTHNPLAENSDCESLLYSLLQKKDLLDGYDVHFGAFDYRLKRLIDKGYKYLKFNEDRTYTYFRIEQVFSLICYYLYEEDLFKKYDSIFNEFKELDSIEQRIEAFKNILKKVEEGELEKKSGLGSFYLEYI